MKAISNIYRIVEIDNNCEAKVYVKNFFGSKEKVESKIEELAFSLEHGGRNPRFINYTGHRWYSVHIENEGWLTATYCKKVIIDSEMNGEKYHKEFVLGYVTYEVEE